MIIMHFIDLSIKHPYFFYSKEKLTLNREQGRQRQLIFDTIKAKLDQTHIVQEIPTVT